MFPELAGRPQEEGGSGHFQAVWGWYTGGQETGEKSHRHTVTQAHSHTGT